MNINELKLNGEYRVAMANDLITGHQRMTLRESQIISIAVSNIVKEDKDFKAYSVTLKELSKFMGIDFKNLHRDIKGICKNLMGKYIEVKKGDNKWDLIAWFQSIGYADGRLYFKLSEDLKPYLIDLQAYYSQPKLSTVLTFKTYYAKRFYEFLLAVDGSKRNGVTEWHLSCDEIRELFQVGNTYGRNYNLLMKTIKPAIEEMNKTDFIHVYDYEEVHESTMGKRGKPQIAGIRFKAAFFEGDEHRTAKQKKDFYLVHLPQLTALAGKGV